MIKKTLRLLKRPFLSWAQYKSLKWQFLLAAVSGTLFRFAFPKIEWGWIAYFAMVPFLLSLQGRNRKESAWLGFAFGMFFFYLNLTWLNTLVKYNPAAPLGIFAVAAICAAVPALFAALVTPILSSRGFFRFLFIPALWTGLEYVRSLSELGFPWIYLGHTQVDYLPMIQIADITGVYGITFMIVAVNLALADVVRGFLHRDRFKLALPGLAFALAAFFSIYFYGNWQLGKSSSDPDKPRQATVAIIQPGVPQSTKLDSYASDDMNIQASLQAKMNEDLEREIKKIHSDALAGKTPMPVVYILPESALPSNYFNLLPELTSLVKRWAEQYGAPVFFGANRAVPPKDPLDPETSEMYNSAWLATAKELEPVSYDKMHLVPFGEFGSYLDVIPGFTDYILGIGNFNLGKRPRIFQVGQGNEKYTFGCVICFESCFPFLFRMNDKANPDWMTVITNDAWYDLSSGGRRHETQAIFRAIEMRRPIVRAAQSGISCIIDVWGRETAKLEMQEGEQSTPPYFASLYIVDKVPLRPESMKSAQTIYMRPWGEWFSWLCLLIALAGLVVTREMRIER